MPDDVRPVTPGQIVCRVTYNMYARNRDMGIASERMYCVFGQVPVELMEAVYREEKRLREGQ